MTLQEEIKCRRRFAVIAQGAVSKVNLNANYTNYANFRKSHIVDNQLSAKFIVLLICENLRNLRNSRSLLRQPRRLAQW